MARTSSRNKETPSAISSASRTRNRRTTSKRVTKITRTSQVQGSGEKSYSTAKSEFKTPNVKSSAKSGKNVKKMGKGHVKRGNCSRIDSEGESSVNTVNENEEDGPEKAFEHWMSLFYPSSSESKDNKNKDYFHISSDDDSDNECTCSRYRPDIEVPLVDEEKNSFPSCVKDQDVAQPSCSKDPDIELASEGCSKDTDNELASEGCSKDPDMELASEGCSKDSDNELPPEGCSKDPNIELSSEDCSTDPNIISSLSKNSNTCKVCGKRTKSIFETEEMKGYLTSCFERVEEAMAKKTGKKKSSTMSEYADESDYSDEYPLQEHDPKTLTGFERFVLFDLPNISSDDDSTIDNVTRMNEENINDYFKQLKLKEELSNNTGCMNKSAKTKKTKVEITPALIKEDEIEHEKIVGNSKRKRGQEKVASMPKPRAQNSSTSESRTVRKKAASRKANK